MLHHYKKPQILMQASFISIDQCCRDPMIPAAYAAPFPSSLYRAGVARWPLLVPLLK